MAIIWDPEKRQKLLAERDIDIQEIADILLTDDYIDILENPSRPGQQIFVVHYHKYVHVVPFVIDDNDNIILKTVFPSRKFHQLYGESNENKTW